MDAINAWEDLERPVRLNRGSENTTHEAAEDTDVAFTP
jgi:hypothetical protein